MASTKPNLLQQIFFAAVVGILLSLLLFFGSNSDPQIKARELVPDELVVGEMAVGYFKKDSGAALFGIEGPIPKFMYAKELRPNIGGGTRTPGYIVEKIQWAKVTWYKPYVQGDDQNCACFACINDVKLCKVASEWLDSEGTLFYLNSKPNGPSYILNREERKIIVVWNRTL